MAETAMAGVVVFSACRDSLNLSELAEGNPTMALLGLKRWSGVGTASTCNPNMLIHALLVPPFLFPSC